ncbi:hypothetical protein [Klebsiella pasteurii]|uniref:hypothetical protein n=1 Tax=Klebsiella pasteurii TaxID=2587529 RepID=UPI0035D08504
MSGSVFITAYNFKKIIPDEFPDGFLKKPEDIIEYSRIKNIFNQSEIDYFIKLWFSIENPEYLVKFYKKKYNASTPDIYNSYHITPDCIELNKAYLDYTINSKDKDTRKKVSSKIRMAFYDYTYNSNIPHNETLIFNFKENTLKSKTPEGKEKYHGKIPEKLYIDVSHINNDFKFILGEIFHIVGNSGYYQYYNTSIVDMEYAIKSLIDESYKFREQDKYISKKVMNITFCGIQKLKNNKNDEVGNTWANKYKGPLYEMISQYYWIKFNPELSIEKNLLDTLGFKPCKRCFSSKV